MVLFAAGLLLVPLLDQTIKRLVVHLLGTAAVPLGPLGALRVVRTRIWLARASSAVRTADGARGLADRTMWVMWSMAAAIVLLTTTAIPAAAAFSGLLLGGSASHAFETSRRGAVCDYICLRFWPAFNLADIAVTIGAAGIVFELLTALSRR